MAVVPHGVRLSLGGAEPLDPARVTHLAACAAAVDAPLVSEHVAYVRAGGREAGHLLPVPRSRDALDVLTAHVTTVQAELDVPLALEPIAALFDWPDDEYTEGEFLTALLERTGALLLLDVANVYANAVNRGTDPEALLDAIPLERVAYVHVAGGAEHPADPGVYHDTHTDPVPDGVLTLLQGLCDRLATAPAVMLERDGRYPPAAQLHAELDAIAAAAALPRGHGMTDLAARQAALVDALVAGGPVPAGFDAGPPGRGPPRPGPQARGRRGGAVAGARRLARARLARGVRRAPSRAGRRRPRSTTVGGSPGRCTDAASSAPARPSSWPSAR